ncbi:hypothetical protein NTE_00714 [Candidatus Nitrososphaera evergladensis SR1]|uniref:Uncharacterized protein n=1 Tax=Candidatus Nitrososphaera evergladensis SR1 TaxID=1459636 RepID=A0A075MU30_9ARCH|nr:hypothetical protein [Candidatus Nitrososphaera evergladensis]AIF82794.1 hypothetical protein NTE_00714 [Candidatus Nitrososphaera evergladensis SR1]
MFASSVDALLYAIRNGRGITDVQANLGYLRNGIKRCCVQVVCKDGAEFHIEAYGEEADALFHEAKKHRKREYLALA